jgi:peptidyl-prolyl cis-trans isomerase A (cyclophilin A)
VNNFLNYVNDGDYDGSFIHRSVPGFVIQGGGFRFVNNVLVLVPTDASIQDTPGPSNLRGTIAMAESDPDGLPQTPGFATSQWFINLVDNPGLDAEFTVFGQVTVGLDVVDQLALVPVFNGSGIHSAFSSLPLMNFVPPDAVEANFVMAPITLPEPHGVAVSWLALGVLAALSRLRRG